ncbi:MAG: hypothetical protein PUH41_04660 [Prevotella sp.]|nr:hypothetical protein [Prevotella sp.]
MKIKNIFLSALTLICLLGFSGCKDNDDPVGDPYLTFENIEGTINVSKAGITQAKRKAVTVRSNSAWKVALENPDDASWLHFFIDEGEDDGLIYYWVDKNTTFDQREGKITLSDNGKVLNSLDIVQEADVPNITIKDGSNGFTIAPEGSVLKVAIDANITWKATLTPDVDWARITNVTEDTIFVTIDKNEEDERTVNLSLVGEGEHSGVSTTALITQKDESLIFNDNLSWLQEGEEKPTYETPEIRIDLWNDAEKAAGWSSLSNWAYGGRGYIKLGKTNYNGDVISPALSKLKKPTDVKVTFQSMGYVSAGGVKDASVVKVGVIGPGEVNGDEVNSISINGTAYRCVKFVNTVFPNSEKNENGEDYDPWAQPGSYHSFTITGATAETKIIFVGGDNWNKVKGKNRVFLKSVEVVRLK